MTQISLSTRKTDRTRAAFTLFELVLVMAIIVIIVSIAVPLMLYNMESEGKVNAAADMIRARWNDARTQAIEEGRPYRFGVIPNSGMFCVEPYDPDSPDSPQLQTASDGVASLVIKGTEDAKLPTGIRFSTADVPVDGDVAEPTGGSYVTVAVFLPDGSAQDDVEISFGGFGGMPLTLKLRAITGIASTKREGSQ